MDDTKMYRYSDAAIRQAWRHVIGEPTSGWSGAMFEAFISALRPFAPTAWHGSYILSRNIEEFEWSSRTRNCFRNAGIITLGDLVTLNEKQLLKIKRFGKKCLNETTERLCDLGLALRMKLEDVGGHKVLIQVPPAKEDNERELNSQWSKHESYTDQCKRENNQRS
jgi:hypothetical protein